MAVVAGDDRAAEVPEEEVADEEVADEGAEEEFMTEADVDEEADDDAGADDAAEADEDGAEDDAGAEDIDAEEAEEADEVEEDDNQDEFPYEAIETLHDGKCVVKMRQKLTTPKLAEGFLFKLQEFIELEKLEGKVVVFEDFDISQNKIPFDQLSDLFSTLTDGSVHVERFRCFGVPTLNDEAATMLAGWLADVADDNVPFEMHLSDCAITKDGFEEIMQAVENNSAFPGKDPKNPSKGKLPMYLRLEHNYIDEEALKSKIEEGVMQAMRKTDPARNSDTIKIRLMVVQSGSLQQNSGEPPAPEDAPPPKRVKGKGPEKGRSKGRLETGRGEIAPGRRGGRQAPERPSAKGGGRRTNGSARAQVLTRERESRRLPVRGGVGKGVIGTVSSKGKGRAANRSSLAALPPPIKRAIREPMSRRPLRQAREVRSPFPSRPLRGSARAPPRPSSAYLGSSNGSPPLGGRGARRDEPFNAFARGGGSGAASMARPTPSTARSFLGEVGRKRSVSDLDEAMFSKRQRRTQAGDLDAADVDAGGRSARGKRGGKRHAAQSLPDSWEPHWSEEYGLYYYWNSKTGDSSWEKPTR